MQVRHRSVLVALVCGAAFACGPAGPGQGEGGTVATEASTEATSQASEPTGSVPTGDGPEGYCGPCNTLLSGDLSPTNLPQIDGFIVAADQLRTAVAAIEGEFAADIGALAAVYGIPAGTVDVGLVSQLTAAIQGDIAANLAGPVRVVYAPGECHANIDVAVEAQRHCEVAGGCDVLVVDERPAVACAGTCVGSCSGACSGPGSCIVAMAAGACSGLCTGSCTAGSGGCMGSCVGDCTGACGHFDANGSCAGRCDGECLGSCATDVAVACDGACSGTCRLEQGDAACSGAVTCAGACSGECAGECVGTATPPATPGCEASLACQAQAGMQGLASVWCSPPAYQLQYTFKPGLDFDAQGGFIARMQQLERRVPAIVQGAHRLGVLVAGEVDGVVLFDPAPTVAVVASISQLVSMGIEGLGIPSARAPCVLPALQAAVKALAEVATTGQDTLQAQSVFVAFVTTLQ